MLVTGCAAALDPNEPTSQLFADPAPVAIAGYTGDAMEPFVTPDGRDLLFNNSNDPQVDTNLHFAERVDALHFNYRGELQGVNTLALEGVPTLDRDGHIYFVSTQSYAGTASTLYRGQFSGGAPQTADLVLAQRHGDSWQRHPDSTHL